MPCDQGTLRVRDRLCLGGTEGFVILNGELVWPFACEFSLACACEHRLQEALTEEQRGGRRSRAARGPAARTPPRSPLQFPASAPCCVSFKPREVAASYLLFRFKWL